MTHPTRLRLLAPLAAALLLLPACGGDDGPSVRTEEDGGSVSGSASGSGSSGGSASTTEEAVTEAPAS